MHVMQRLKLKNISGISGKEYLYPNDEVFLDERIISIIDGQAMVPCLCRTYL